MDPKDVDRMANRVDPDETDCCVSPKSALVVQTHLSQYLVFYNMMKYSGLYGKEK